MHRVSRFAAGASLLALTLIGVAPLAGHAAAKSEITGHVYVNDNTARANTIAAFDRHADGSLSTVPGSPFATGGAGLGTIMGSQGALQETSDGKYLLAVNAGDSTISVLAIADDGTLTAAGDPVASGGATPLSIAVHDNHVYVANAGDGKCGSNYTGFKLSDDGALTPIPSSTVAISATASPGDILFNATGKNLVGIEVGPDTGPSFIDSFAVGSDGTLTAAPGSPFAAQVTGPFGSAFSPTDPTKLFVSNAHGGPNAGSVSAYDVAADGTLTAIAGSPFPNAQTAPCWLEIGHDGKYVYTVNTAVPSISTYAVGKDGALTLKGSTVFNDPTGLRPFDARLDGDGKFLYTVDAGLAKVSAFAVDGATLTEIASSPVALPAGATPFGIVVD
jgi:6-phosphogluconolactonase